MGILSKATTVPPKPDTARKGLKHWPEGGSYPESDMATIADELYIEARKVGADSICKTIHEWEDACASVSREAGIAGADDALNKILEGAELYLAIAQTFEDLDAHPPALAVAAEQAAEEWEAWR